MKYLFTTIILLCFAIGAFPQHSHRPQHGGMHNDSTRMHRPPHRGGMSSDSLHSRSRGTAGISFVESGSLPDLTKFLPDPPVDSDALYENDKVMYEWGKMQRNTLRGDTAVQDASLSVSYIMKRFGCAMGKDVTPENCPKLATLISGLSRHLNSAVARAKRYYKRERPYRKFGEHTSLPQREASDYSYPSGHSITAWGVAMLFVTLDPSHEDAILKTGYDIGESRVIVGYHYQSDVDAARLSASACYARLCAEPAFWSYIQLAKSELDQLK